MKWENFINVVEQTNIPKFSKLDNIGIPFRLFESFFVDALVDVILGYTRLYGHREKADTRLQCSGCTNTFLSSCSKFAKMLSFL